MNKMIEIFRKNFLSIRIISIGIVRMISPLLRLDGLNYMKRYFDMYNDPQRQCKQFDCDQISKQFRLSWIGQHHHEKCSICQVVSFIELILLICIIHPIVQMFQDDSNTFNNYLTANLFAITPVGRRILVLFIIMFVIQIQYYLHRLYYRNQTVSILNAVLFQQDRQQFHPPYRYRTRMAGKVAKDIAMMAIKMVNLFMFITSESFKMFCNLNKFDLFHHFSFDYHINGAIIIKIYP